VATFDIGVKRLFLLDPKALLLYYRILHLKLFDTQVAFRIQSAAMQSQNLPIHVDPLRCVETATELRGSYPLKNLSRLAPSLYTSEGEVEAEFAFGTDSGGVKFLRGQFKSYVTLQCQRCLEPLFHQVNGTVRMGLVSSEVYAKKLPNSYDALIVSEDAFSLQDFIEEELIISLPLVPMHSEQECKVKLPLVVAKDEGADAEKNNPFSVIAALKSTSSDRDKK
jgi:uncharacterized protein